MGLVEQVKLVRELVIDHCCPQRVVFHHVPKCAGTSVGRALRKRYILSQATVLPEKSFRAFEAFTGRTDRERMLVDVLDLREQMFLYLLFEDIRCISLHVPFSLIAHRLFADHYKFVTVLREPVSRFLSHYFWSFDKPHAHARIEEELDSFLNTKRARRLGATYIRYFSGLQKDADITDVAAIRAAKENLEKFDVVVIFGEWGGFEHDIKHALGVRLKIRHENRTHRPSNPNDQIVTPDLRARVKALCAPDIAVWEHAHAINSFQNGDMTCEQPAIATK